MLSEDQIGITKDELIRTYELMYKWGQIQSYATRRGYLSDSQLSYATKIESAARVHLKHGLEALIDAYTKWVEMFKNTPHDDEEWLKFEIRIVDTLEYMNSVSSDLGSQIAAFNRGVSTAHQSGKMGEYVLNDSGPEIFDDLSEDKYTAEWDRELNKVFGKTASLIKRAQYTMYHATPEYNVESILKHGLVPRKEKGFTIADQAWLDEIYGGQPVFLSVYNSHFYKVHGNEVVLQVDVVGLSLLADLPSLVDIGGYLEEAEVWWEEGAEPHNLSKYLDKHGAIKYRKLVKPGFAADAAIKDTGTAVVLGTIPPDRIRVHFGD